MESGIDGGAIVVWLLFGLIAGYINQSKGNPFATGCLLGVLLGPIGLLIALISGRNEEELERRGVVVGQTRHCPYCAELVKAEAKVCKHCGRDISKG
ncbi:MAG: zinc ribbon domain-containing protein [Anaerolineae bacterium]|nr:zinc ribbon domain-containing protein [Anaerolineae bacterium]